MVDPAPVERPAGPPEAVAERAPEEGIATLLRSAYHSVLGAAGAVYVSMPITTGERLVAWCEAHPGARPSPDEHRAEVMDPNVAAGRAVADRIRATSALPAVDPSGLSVPGWGQPEYNGFWHDIVRRHAREVVVVDGWEYSTGCCIELSAARAQGLIVRDEGGQEIDDDRARTFLTRAVERLTAVGLPCDEQQRMLDAGSAAPRP